MSLSPPVPPLLRTPRELADHLAAHPRRSAPSAGELAAACVPRLHYPLGSAQADIVAVAAGLKPVLRSTLSRADARATVARYRNLGLQALAADAHDRHGEARLYLGRDRARILAAAAAEEARDDRLLGQLLGYPRCCVEAFLRVPQPRTAAAVLSLAFGGRVFCHARLNCIDLHVFHYVPWLPCGPACALSRRYADAVAEAIPRLRSALGIRADVDLVRFVGDIDRALAAHRLHLLPGVQLSLTGSIAGGAIVVDRAWPTAADRHAGAPLSADEQEAVVHLLRSIEPGQSLAVADDTLLLDGRPLVRTPHLFLACFADPGRAAA